MSALQTISIQVSPSAAKVPNKRGCPKSKGQPFTFLEINDSIGE
jgi:hypothetical protein